MTFKAAGYCISILGFVSFVLLIGFEDIQIPNKLFWQTTSFISGLVGCFFLYVVKVLNGSEAEQYHYERVSHFVRDGDRILMTLDNCTIKENNYYEDIIHERRSTIRALDDLYDPSRNMEKRYVEQSVIIYKYHNNQSEIRMISQTFYCNSEKLRYYIDSGMVFLFVDKQNKNEYMFTLN
ncbi:MAG: hypothetical protein IPN14_11980 [Bacteroidetes bacterium]|jgi:hypothetical protein|nr:hypothetical protein [Bacteroidota bacterium]